MNFDGLMVQKCHEILGLSTSFSSGFICRSCSATEKFIRANVSSLGIEGKRDDDCWEEQIFLFKESRERGSWLKSIPVFYGISPKSHCSMYPIDILHNFVLGIYPDYLAAILPTFLSADMMELINHLMPQMKFHGCSVFIKKSGHVSRNRWNIKGNAKEQYNFFLNLPETLNNVFSTHFGSTNEDYAGKWDEIIESSEWKGYLLLRMIDCFIRQDSFKPSDLTEIDHLVQELFRVRNDCDLGQRITPKLHYLTHVTSEILTHGPLIVYDTTRFERKHQTFKRESSTSFNAINHTKSLVQWNQVVTAVGVPSEFNKVVTVKGKKKPITKSDIEKIGSESEDLLHTVRSIEAENHQIKKGQVYYVNGHLFMVELIARIKSNHYFKVYGCLYSIDAVSEPFHFFLFRKISNKYHGFCPYSLSNRSCPRMYQILDDVYINKIINV